MGGDGMGGLAAAIALASLCMLLAPALVLGAAGYVVARKRAGWAGALAGAVLGVGVGAVAVLATFWEDVWSPPTEVVLEVPAGFAYDEVVLLEDASVGAEVSWSGVELPFSSRRATVRVPASGVARVRSFDGILGPRRGEARLSTGARSVGFASGPAPVELGARSYAIWSFVPFSPGRPELPTHDPAELARVLRAREAGR